MFFLNITILLVPSYSRMLVFKSAVEPNPKFAGRFLYEKVLPYLTSMPVLSALQVSDKLGSAVNDSRPVPLGGDKSFVNCAVECLRYIGRAAGLGCAQANHLPMVVSAGILLMVESDLELVKILSPPEADLVTMACRALARVAAAQVGLQGSSDQEDATTMSVSQLNAVSDSISAVGRKLQQMDERMVAPPAFSLKADEQLAQVCEWPLFGRLRRDFDVEALAGDAPVAPIIRPVEMTLVPDHVSDFQGVAAAMRHALNLCVLLANQRSVVRNSYTLRVCMLEHLFVRVIPLPLPITHKKRDTECFWHAQPMRFETQADILRLLSLLSQHFATASLSVKSTRSGDAVRMLTFACMATVCDAALRKIACDIPSQSSLHYSGRAKGPIHPFGFELGTFEEESEYLKLSFPESAVARTQVLDYFHQMKKVIKQSHILFGFENMECSSTDRKFIDQLCLQVGFDRELELEYLTGEDDVLLAHYPEVGYVRDIVFMLKLVMVPTSDRLPELKHWTPKDAGLKWGNRDGKYTVLAFGKSLDCSQEQESVEEQQVSQKAPRGAMARLFRYLGFTGKKPRSTPSQANPSILLGERVDTEDDILHIRNLPDFDGTLGARDCELMLQYLTAPYMRIPLLLSFFSNEVRLKALRNTNMQEVLDAALFEPGQWKCEFDIPLPSQIPAAERDHLCTPVGLLFNEIVMSPNAIMASVLHMLERVVDMDSGKYSELGESILYVTRLAIRVEGYLLFLIRNKRFHSLQKESETNMFNGAYVKADVRGLRCGEVIISEALDCQRKIRVLLEEKMFKIIARWIKRSKKDGRFGQACMLHAHLALIYRNVEPEELTPRVVFTVLASQIFLFNYYKYDLDLEQKDETMQVKRTDIEDIRGDLGVPQVELFAMFQRCRRMVFNWLGDHNSERNQVMDAIVQMVEEGQRKHILKKSERSQFNWIAIEQAGMNFAGRFVPDIEHDEEVFLLNLSAATKCSFEEWLRETTTLSVNTEINVQLGEFTVRKNITKPCDDSMTNDKDFISAFSSLRINDVIQCADVMNTTNRQWVRLVGLGYDLQLWAPDTRRPAPPIKSSYDDCTTQWIKVRTTILCYACVCLCHVTCYINSTDYIHTVTRTSHRVQVTPHFAIPCSLSFSSPLTGHI